MQVQKISNTNSSSPNNCFRTIGDKVTLATKDLVAAGYEKWHFAQVNRLGASKYMALADEARKGFNPPQLFTYLIRKN